MSPKQHTALQRLVEAFLVALVGGAIAAVLLGVYALASLVF